MVSVSSTGFFKYIYWEPSYGGKQMFEEFVKTLSLIGSGEQTVWNIAQIIDVPITRFRMITSKLLDLKYVRYEAHCFKYYLTVKGENVLKES